MLIDWFTVGAQVLNFLILVGLLKHFLYKPILNAIDAREKRIASELADAEAKQSAAQKERDIFQHKNDVFEQQRADLLRQVEDEVNAERLRLLDAARKECDDLRTKRLEALRTEQQTLNDTLTHHVRDEVFAIARKVLDDLADIRLDAHMVDVFIRRLRGAQDEEKALLMAALQPASAPVIVRSMFDLPPAQRTLIESAIKETLSVESPIQFETAPDLIGGMVLIAPGHKIAWSIADYLASLQDSVAELWKAQDKPASSLTAAHDHAA